MVGLEKLCHDYGDRIVGMAVHNGDPMALAEYGFTGQMIKGYPSALINREYEIDPYYGITDDEPYGVRYPVEWVLENSVAPADMEVQAVWNSDSTAIDVTTHTTFLFDSNSANYALCYVLVADSLHGDPAQGWQQKNGYSGRTSLTDPDLLPWVERPEWVKDLYYYHVAIGVWGAQKGLDASVSAPLQAEASQTHTHTIPTDGNSLVQNKRLLHVAVVLYDTQSGLAVNACQTTILPAGETGIVPFVALPTQQTEQVYDLQGRRVTSSPDVRRSAGLRIVRDTDGKTRKLFIH